MSPGGSDDNLGDRLDYYGNLVVTVRWDRELAVGRLETAVLSRSINILIPFYKYFLFGLYHSSVTILLPLL